MSVVGRAMPHESAEGHVTGEAHYTDDLLERHPGVLHAWPVLSNLAHAEVVAIDTQAAERLPGVVKVLTAAAVPGENDVGPVRHDEPLFPGEVMFHGQPIAWVLAETLEQARSGAAAVVVELRELPAILTMREALAAGSFLTDPLSIVHGDVPAALADAPHVLEGELEIGGQEHFYLETQAALACWDEAGLPLVHSSTQHPTETQLIVARVLGRPRNEVTCQSLRMGGAFGGKETQANAIAAVAALGLQVTGRPVRVRLDRQLDMTVTGKRHPFWARYRVGHDDQGRLLALDLELFSDGGWSLDLSKAIMYRALFHCDGVYRWPNLRVVGRVLATHKTSQTAFRGFGGPQGALVAEEVLDRVARSCGLPLAEVRRRNFYRPGDTTHYGQSLRDAERIERVFERVRESGEYERRLDAIASFNAGSVHEKRGLAIVPIKFGISFTTAFLNQAGALVLVYGDGSVQVNHGGTEMGQGLHTKIRQIAADALGVPIDAIRLMPTRTDKVPNTSATAASSGSDLNGAAVERACLTIRERLAALAGRSFAVDPAAVVFAEGRVRAGDASLAFAELANRAHLERVPLFATGYYATPDIHFDEPSGRGKPFHYFTFGAAISEVEVDGFTGAYQIRRVDIVHDVGDSISPLIDRGQIEGGFIQGLGWLTCEQLVWDAKGRLATRGASTYKLPGLGECPEEFHVELLPNAGEPLVVRGSKAVGEPPLLLALSVREALRAAVAAFGREGCKRVELGCPSTAEAVYWAIEAVR
jgi:xanthine dehydrogenase large subunit